MADIFISYASEDRERASRIASVLESCGWSVWWDRKIVAGQAFDEAIERELEAAKCVIVLWSQESIDSEWVKNEAAVASERGVLVPALIDRVKLPLEFRRRQTADMVGWDGNTSQEGFQALCNGVAAKVAPGKSTALCPPAAFPVHRSRPRFRWKWASVSAITVFLGLVVSWVWFSNGDKSPTDDLADLVAGVYHGDVVSDAKGGSVSAVTLTITKMSQRKVRVASDYQRLGVIEIELNRVGNTIQSTGGRSLLLLEMEKNPPRLSFNPDGEVAYVGHRRSSSSPPHSKIYKNSIGMEFVLIPSGSFTMGSNFGRESEKPPHHVEISQSFYLHKTEVTQGQWKKVMGDTPSSFKECGDDCPVEQVSWDDVKEFIKKLNVMESTDKYRLPTEAEWEYAYRAEKTTEFSFGDDASNLGEYAWYDGNSKAATHRVSAKKPNPWGLYDMHGNVWEWVEDDWHDWYDGAPVGEQAWVDNPRDARRVIRGGSWESVDFDCRSSTRFGEKPASRSFSLGFRVAKSFAYMGQ
jgi:formylglycine-generating enzyme required for sulfatase activity